MPITLLLSACTSSSSTAHHAPATAHTASPAPAGTPALTKPEALAQISRFSKVNNQAGPSGDRKLLDTVEDGPLYAMSLSDIKQDAALPQAARHPYRPWSYDLANTDVYIPRFTAGQPQWFAAVTYAGSDRAKARLLVMAEQVGTTRWEMVSTVDIDSPKQLPEIAVDGDGYATAVDTAAAGTLSVPVDALRTAVLDNFSTGGTTTGTTVFSPTTSSQRQIKVHDDTVGKFGTRGTTRFSPARTEFPASYALRTADGGALVVFAHTHIQRDAVARRGLAIMPDTEDRAWLGTKARPSFTYTFTCSDAATVPAAPGRATLIGYACRRTDATSGSSSSSAA
ncbi:MULTISPECIES: hypothetical protein [unclassified Streptomyces]|uniref:hypothetical protein n=1 Tax=unclassified Streptomyces TaxID=2593676 RepID=UPI0036371C49